MQNKRLSYGIITLFAVIKFLVPFLLIHPQFELHRDEFLYLADADHLAWGYIEMPPLLAFMGYLSKLAGGSIYTVYFWGGFTGALTVFIIGKAVLQLRGSAVAVFMACLAFLCSGFLRMHILFQPNFLDVLFWTWASYLIICWIDTNDKKFVYWLGVCFGLGILGKYSMAFYIIAFAVAVLLTERRKWLLNPHFYVAMGLGILICLPNLLWQWTHHFPVMHHMDLLTKQQLQYNSRVDFIVNQLLILLPCLFIWMGGLWFLLMKPQGRQYILLAFIYIGIIALLLYFNGKGYHAAAIYPTLIIFGGIWLAQLSAMKRGKWLLVAAPALMLFLTWRLLPMLLPYQSPEALSTYYGTHAISKPALIWEDHKEHALPQDFADMLGWKEMAEKTARIYHSLPDTARAKTMVYGDNYGQAGALSFYRKALGLPEIYSDNASYVFWLPDHFTQRYFLFVTEELPDADDTFFAHWQKREILDSVTNPLAREYRSKIILYSQPDDSVHIIADKNTLREKQLFKLR
jgi:4-amino-4-deoxy-L-arabinose transferase-like glycosyltransferase